ncbi:hypothetical protein BGW38_008245, partial [Lunasporangiospora selenospora]
ALVNAQETSGLWLHGSLDVGTSAAPMDFHEEKEMASRGYASTAPIIPALSTSRSAIMSMMDTAKVMVTALFTAYSTEQYLTEGERVEKRRVKDEE